MVQQTEVLPRHKNWRRIYFRILKKLQSEKVISKFDQTDSIDKEIVNCYQLYINENKIKVYFYNSRFRDEVNLAEDFFDHISIMVGRLAQQKPLEFELRESLKIIMAKRETGLNLENTFEIQVGKILNPDSISSIEKVVELIKDMNGIDFYLTFKNNKVPLQVKSSKSERHVHELKYPHIPSINFIPEHFTLPRLKMFLIQLCEAYLEGRILHL